MRRHRFVFVTKYVVYVLVFIGLYILQNNPISYMKIHEIKPILLLPAAIALSMVEGEFVGGVFGAIAGLLCDFASFSLYGFNAIVTMVYCVLVGLATIYLIKPSWLNCLLLTLLFMLLRGGLDFFFSYGLWGYEGWEYLLTHEVIGIAIYSTVLSPLYLWMFKKMQNYFHVHS